ncbi:MAG: hypothetical protein GF384_08010 [Elusimicrobia bacterium]|nr:hypothetical protein [Elusimicrobiota bacterium]MBD3412579.1 hypothetical protein [Elusimicrobiota bacterium]
MRKLIYILVLFLFIAGMMFKAHQVRLKEKEEIISITAEWQSNGKPVDVITIQKKPMIFITKVSGTIHTGSMIITSVPKDIWRNLQPRQRFNTCKSGQRISGEVISVASDPDVVTGFYDVVLKITSSHSLSQGTIIVACVVTEQIEETITVPLRAVMRKNGERFCWVVTDHHAVKKPVKTGRENQDSIQILNGLSVGDRIVVDGMSVLKDHDTIRMRYQDGEPV